MGIDILKSVYQETTLADVLPPQYPPGELPNALDDRWMEWNEMMEIPFRIQHMRSVHHHHHNHHNHHNDIAHASHGKAIFDRHYSADRRYSRTPSSSWIFNAGTFNLGFLIDPREWAECPKLSIYFQYPFSRLHLMNPRESVLWGLRPRDCACEFGF